MAFGQIAIAITAIGPRNKLPTARFFQSSTSCALVNLRTFIFRHHPLHLGEQFSLRSITKRVLQKNPLHVEFLKLFDQ